MVLPPQQAVSQESLERGLTDKIVGALCTRYRTTVAHAREVLRQSEMKQWSKLQILGEGDLIRTVGAEKGAEDSRDASFVRVHCRSCHGRLRDHADSKSPQYELLVDKNAQHPNRREVFQKVTHFGQLHHIFQLTLPHEPEPIVPIGAAAASTEPTVILFAAIRAYPITDKHPSLDIHFFTVPGTLDIVDVSTIECLVGRLKAASDSHKWAIIDRSGSLARAIYMGDDDDNGV